MGDLARLNALVHGKVQGVYYRAFTFRIARSLGVKGYVKNVKSGDVAIDAEGEKVKLEEMLRQLKIGPAEAIVGNIDTKWSDYTGQYSEFDIRY